MAIIKVCDRCEQVAESLNNKYGPDLCEVCWQIGLSVISLFLANKAVKVNPGRVPPTPVVEPVDLPGTPVV